MVLGIVAFLGALWLWPHFLAAPCLVVGGVLLTLGGVSWRLGRGASSLANDSAATPTASKPQPSGPSTSEEEDSEGRRRDLVANVSHELKTPLTAIRGYAETLEDGALEQPEVARRFTGRILEQCERLETLLHDLLTLSWLEGDEESEERQGVDLETLLRATVELLAPQAIAREVEVTLEVEAGASHRIGHRIGHCIGDPEQLERMLKNLLENAIKYNRQGGTVWLRLRADEERMLLEVEDTGIGIPPGNIDRVFERFYRVDKGRSRDQGGTGLGLAIVKHVVRGHGGQIEVSSRLGEGSLFRVWLPAVSS